MRPGRAAILAAARPPAFTISDGANGGTAGFYFLSPLVPDPVSAGTFDPALAPEVRICELGASGCATTVASFSASTSPAVTVDPNEESYAVVWKTKDANLNPASSYRLDVRVGAVLLGLADIDVVPNPSALKDVAPGFVGLAAAPPRHPVPDRDRHHRRDHRRTDFGDGRIGQPAAVHGGLDVFAYDGDASWAPDAGRIAIVLGSSSAPPTIHLLPLGGTPVPLAPGGGPRWSPDGHRIVFYQNTGGPLSGNEIWVVNADGTGLLVQAASARPRRTSRSGTGRSTTAASSEASCRAMITPRGVSPVDGLGISVGRVGSGDEITPHGGRARDWTHLRERLVPGRFAVGDDPLQADFVPLRRRSYACTRRLGPNSLFRPDGGRSCLSDPVPRRADASALHRGVGR